MNPLTKASTMSLHSALSREHFLLNDLYDKQTDNCHRGDCSLSALPCYYLFIKFGGERKVRNKTTILNIFLIQHIFIKQRTYGGSFEKHSGITDTTIDLLIIGY